VSSAQRKAAAIGCWVAALAIVVSHASENDFAAYRYRTLASWLFWLGTFSYGWAHELGGLWAILLAALGAIAWVARVKVNP